MRTILQNSYLFTFASNILIVLVGLVTSILLARNLGPVGRGEVAAVLIWPSMLSYMGNLGIPEAVLYFASRPNASLKSIYGSSVLISILQSLVVVSAGFLLMPSLLASQNVEIIMLGRVCLLMVPANIVAQIVNSILRSQMKFKACNILQSVVPIGYFLSIVVLMVTDMVTIQHVVFAQLLLSMLSLCMVHLALVLSRIPFGIDIRFSLIRQLWNYGLKAHIGNLSSVANMRLDQALLAAWAPSEQLGAYVVAVNVASFVLILPRAIYYVLTPIISQLAELESQRRKFTEVFQIYWLVNVIVSVLMLFMIAPIILVFYGSDFTFAVIPAQILVMACTILGINTVLMGAAQAVNDPFLASRAELAASIFTFVALVLLLPAFGIVGAALISFTAYSVALAILGIGLRNKHGFELTELFRLDHSIQHLVHKLRLIVR